jgi:hypothetical protein
VNAVERVAYWTGGLLITSGIIHLAVLLIGGGTWNGPLSLRKPTMFGVSFGVTLVNVTAIASLLTLRDRSRALLLGVFAAACVLETFLVSLQAWRGVPSHFNIGTPLDAAIAQALAVGGFTLVVVVLVLTVAAFRQRAALSRPLWLAIRAGLVALVGAQVAGGVMIATGVRLVLAGDPQRAYLTGGWLKPLHAVLMHGILVLPLLAWLISRLDWDDRMRTRVMQTAVAMYALVVLATIVGVIRTT